MEFISHEFNPVTIQSHGFKSVISNNWPTGRYVIHVYVIILVGKLSVLPDFAETLHHEAHRAVELLSC